MAFDTKTLAVFLPFASAGLAGLYYALAEKVLSSVNLATFVLVYCLVGVASMLLLGLCSPIKIDFSPLADKSTAGVFSILIGASLLAWLGSIFVTKNISASYAAIAEISYPLFAVLFGYLIFSRKIDWSMALGACLIIAGSVVLVAGKLNGR